MVSVSDDAMSAGRVRPGSPPSGVGVGVCPLCDLRFEAGDVFRGHLADEHGLVDDEGTHTDVSGSPSSPDPQDQSGGEDATPIAADIPAIRRGGLRRIVGRLRGQRPPTAATTVEVPPATRERGAADRGPFPLARRHGDVALYLPGLLLVVAAVLRGRSDVLGLAFVTFGAPMLALAILLPRIAFRTGRLEVAVAPSTGVFGKHHLRSGAEVPAPVEDALRVGGDLEPASPSQPGRPPAHFLEAPGLETPDSGPAS